MLTMQVPQGHLLSPKGTTMRATTFADHYILVHRNVATDGRTEERVSGDFLALSHEDRASTEGQAPGGLRQPLFTGTVLRSLLIYGYAFAMVGTIAGSTV